MHNLHTLKIRQKPRALFFILFFAFLLRIIGLTPNFLQHPDEPSVTLPASVIASNIIFNHDTDPNVQPHPNADPYPFKYASTFYYLHSFIETAVLGSGYAAYKITGYTFELSQSAFDKPTFREFFTDIGPTAMSNILMWFHRLPSVIFGTATVLLVYYTSLLLLRNRQSALLAAAAMAVMPHHVRDSHYATITIIQSFFFLLAFYLSTKIEKRTTFKTCVAAGISVGFATSLKYFPLPIIPLFFFMFLARNNMKLTHIAIIFVSLFIGYWLGMPYIFVHWQTMLTTFKLLSNFYAPTQATANQNFLQHFLPLYLHGYHFQFFFNTSVGPILTLVGITGIIIGLKRWPKEATALLLTPIINLVFISFYLEAIYDTLLVPILPFFAIFVGIGTAIIYEYLRKNFSKALIAKATVALIIFIPSGIDSARASIACTQRTTELEAHDWIAENIPSGTALAYQPGMRLPSKDFEFVRSEPKENFLLSEIQTTKAQYIALHTGYIDRTKQWVEDDIFLPHYVKDNEFGNLVLKEFSQNAQLLKAFVRPTMCVNSRIYVYKIPQPIAPAQYPLVGFDFANPTLTQTWQLGNGDHTFPAGVTISNTSTQQENQGVLYSFNSSVLNEEIKHFKKPFTLLNRFIPGGIRGLPPSLYGTPYHSPFITVEEGKKYSAILKAKKTRAKTQTQFSDGLLRIDFYENENGKPIATRFSQRLTSQNNDWETLSLTAYAPPKTRFMTIAFQTVFASYSGDYILQNATVLTD